MNETTKIYEPLWLVKLFNLFPHLNMWFQQVNSTFDPYNPEYLETILFWSTIPILFLILLLLILIIYACCLVCASSNYNNSQNSNNSSNKNHTNNKNNINSNKELLNSKAILCKYKAFIIFSIVLISTTLGFIVYGSETFHYSYQDLTQNINNFSTQFDKISNETIKIKETILNDLNSPLDQLINELNRQNSINNAQINNIKIEINSIRSSLNESINALGSLNQLIYEKSAYKSILKEIDFVELIRWSVMIGKVALNSLLILLLIFGLCKNSKGSLCFFAFIGVVSLISIWILNALYLGLTVFLSDFCINPEEYTLSIAKHNDVRQSVVSFYTKCQANQEKLIFKPELSRAQSKLNTAYRLYKENIIPMSGNYINKTLLNANNFTNMIDISNRMLAQIVQLIKCEQTSINFRNIIRTLCFNSIYGLAIVLLSGFVFGLILPILICIIPQLWRRIHNIYFENGEEAHPFIPITQTRSNISAARQYNESPNFQRLNHNTQSIHSHHNEIHTDPYLKSTNETTNTYSHYLTSNNYNNNQNTPIGSSTNNTGAVGNNNYNLDFNNSSTNVPSVLYSSNRNPNPTNYNPNISGTLSRINQEQTLLIRRKY